MSRNLGLIARLMTTWGQRLWAQQYPAKLVVQRDSERQEHQLPPNTLDSAGGKGLTINLQVDSTAGDHPRPFSAITDSNDSTYLESGIVEANGNKIAGPGKARVGEQFLIDSMVVWPDSSGVASRAALNNPSRLSLSTALSTDLHVSRIAVYLSRQLIKFSYTAFSHGA